jgi:MOSC domain-containing protein YiiM
MVGAVLQVNISRGGVPKRPVPEAFLGPLGLEGDAVAHPKSHGGPEKAILLVSSEAIEELRARGFPVFPGALGENLTTAGLDRLGMRPGQRYRVGDAVIELTRLRQPCRTLDVYGPGIQAAVYDEKVKAGDPSSPRWGLAGFYASVVTTGRVSQGCPIALLDQAA